MGLCLLKFIVKKLKKQIYAASGFVSVLLLLCKDAFILSFYRYNIANTHIDPLFQRTEIKNIMQT